MSKNKQNEETNLRPLPDGAIGQEAVEVTTKFNDEELAAKREDHADLSMQIEDAEEEFKRIKEEHMGSLKILKAKNKTVLHEIRTGRNIRVVNCFKIPNHDAGLMEYVDVDSGEVVDSRRLMPRERQRDLAKDASAATTVQNRYAAQG